LTRGEGRFSQRFFTGLEKEILLGSARTHV
jgi:hypothetical protein